MWSLHIYPSAFFVTYYNFPKSKYGDMKIQLL